VGRYNAYGLDALSKREINILAEHIMKWMPDDDMFSRVDSWHPALNSGDYTKFKDNLIEQYDVRCLTTVEGIEIQMYSCDDYEVDVSLKTPIILELGATRTEMLAVCRLALDAIATKNQLIEDLEETDGR